MHRTIRLYVMWVAILTLAAQSAMAAPSAQTPRAATPDNRPVTQDQLRNFARIFKSVAERTDKLEAKVNKMGGGQAAGGEESLDLSGGNISAAPVGAPKGGAHAHVGSSNPPNFKVFFDLNLVNRPGIEPLSFDTFHSFLFFELLATPDLQFSFDISTSPRFYELDYQVHPRIQLRAGKIWIPFDDMAPHNIFGGKVNVSRLAIPNAPAFLPDLWTDLGVGAKAMIIDTKSFDLEGHLYVVNGFRDGGKDPLNPETGVTGYPSFNDIPSAPDNNRDKAIGGRLHALLLSRLGLGLSYYTGKWNSDSQAEAKRLSILGFDAQLRIKGFEARSGIVSMAVDLPTGKTANRGGLYIELGQRFGAAGQWKLLARGGLLQFDDRVLDTSPTTSIGDQRLIGASLLYKPGLIQYSIETSRDLKESPNKSNYSYTAARIVIAL